MVLHFLDFSFKDFVDIIIVSVLLYNTYKLLKGTVAINIFIGITVVFVLHKITEVFKMELLSSLLGHLISGGAIALIIIFHPEIRKFLLMIGSANFKSKRNLVKQLKFLKAEINEEVDLDSVLDACQKFSQQRTGALIVVERSNNLDFVKVKGDPICAEINVPILESIFYKNSPLHDGAIIVKDNHIVAVRVVLPLSDKVLPSRFGLRHRAAIGITERTDALGLVVSEETGEISFVKDGEFELFESLTELADKIKNYLN